MSAATEALLRHWADRYEESWVRFAFYVPLTFDEPFRAGPEVVAQNGSDGLAVAAAHLAEWMMYHTAQDVVDQCVEDAARFVWLLETVKP